MGNSGTTRIGLALPSVEAKALAHFFKRLDFETVARFSSVSVVHDGKSEADMIWYALIELRRVLAEANAEAQASRLRAAPLTVIPGPGASHRSSQVRR